MPVRVQGVGQRAELLEGERLGTRRRGDAAFLQEGAELALGDF